MNGVNYIAVCTAAFVSFAISFVWYTVFNKTMKKLNSDTTAMEKIPARIVMSEFAESLLLSIGVAMLVAFSGVAGWTSAFHLAFCLWIGFPAVLLSGAVMWEKMPRKFITFRTADWFFKFHSIAVIIGLTR